MSFSEKQNSYRYRWISKNQLVANQGTFWTMRMRGAFKFFKNLYPAYMSDISVRSNTQHNTRKSTHMLTVSAKNTNLSQQDLSYIWPKLWNILSSKIKLSTSANSFKHAIVEDFFAQLPKKENYLFLYPQNYRGRYSNLI